MHINFFALNKCSDVQKSSETVVEKIPNANIEASRNIIIDPAPDVILDSAPDATIEKATSDHNDFQAKVEKHSQGPMKFRI